MQDVLDIKAESLTPDELIRAILTAPVDLLWNGGIGTYVKASTESHRDVGDKNNDNLRVDGRELRCKVMGEGGNLGFTQLGRIEFAQKGGRINTDAIDNSAGVDCSDHEVNIKIAFSQAKNLSKEARDKILESMTDEVADLVLRDNYLQTQAISIAETSGADLLESQSSLMKKLGEIGLLSRQIEFLPDDEEIAARINAKKGLTRPELAVILAYSKLWLYQEILDSTLPDEDYFKADLMRYFPLAMQEKYKSEIENHKLRREIVATFVTNSIVNRAGSTFFHNIIKDTGQSASNVARTYTAARDTFALRDMWKQIELLDGRVESKVQYEMFIEIGKFIERQTFWYLREFAGKADAAEMVKTYNADVISFNTQLTEMLNAELAETTHKQAAILELANVPSALAHQIAALPALSSACDIISVSKATKLPLSFIGKIYFEMGEKLGFNWLRAQGANLKGETYWQRLATRNMVDSLYEHQRRLTAEAAQLAGKAKNPFDVLESFREKNQNDLERHARLIAELKATERTDLAMLVAAVRRVETLCS
jgi:glutamate dehydrogenase